LMLITSAWCRAFGESVGGEAVDLAKRTVSRFLVPVRVTGETVDHYFRKALRSNAWWKLRRESRALLYASRALRVVKSPVLLSILRELFLEIELSTLRGKAVYYGVLVALRQGLREALGDLKKLITLGVGYLNLPLMWRVLG